jgi:hypothetical protein
MEQSLPPTLESLRLDGAQRSHPVEFRYLEALHARMQAQPQAVQRILEKRLSVAVTRFDMRFRQSTGSRPSGNKSGGGVPKPAASVNPLAALNRYIRDVSREGPDTPQQGDMAGPAELKSVRQFRQAWSRIRAEDKVDQALRQVPANAGPLNSHRLVIRTLSLMRDLSPEYLQRFVAQVETMMVLDSTSLKPATPSSKVGRAVKSVKASRQARAKK